MVWCIFHHNYFFNLLSLGFQRSIIGFDNRYSMIGDENVGEYHLQIKNADLGDDAEFQCQVSQLNYILYRTKTTSS